MHSAVGWRSSTRFAAKSTIFANFRLGNIRGLLDFDVPLLVSADIAQLWHAIPPDDVHWGMVMGNVVRSLKLAMMSSTDGKNTAGTKPVHPVGEAGNAAADPAEIALVAKRLIAVALAGVGEVGFLPEDDGNMRRVPLGGRPTALVITPDGSNFMSPMNFATRSQLSMSLRPRKVPK